MKKEKRKREGEGREALFTKCRDERSNSEGLIKVE